MNCPCLQIVLYKRLTLALTENELYYIDFCYKANGFNSKAQWNDAR